MWKYEDVEMRFLKIIFPFQNKSVDKTNNLNMNLYAIMTWL
jgi:hypothetical protein